MRALTINDVEVAWAARSDCLYDAIARDNGQTLHPRCGDEETIAGVSVTGIDNYPRGFARYSWANLNNSRTDGSDRFAEPTIRRNVAEMRPTRDVIFLGRDGQFPSSNW